MLYHLSEHADLKELTPKIPECAVSMYENTDIPRVCFSDFIRGCLSALQDMPRKYFVYVPDEDISIHFPTTNEVMDCEETHEVWSLKPIKVKCIGIIKSSDYVTTKTMKNGSMFFNYRWRWIKKYK